MSDMAEEAVDSSEDQQEVEEESPDRSSSKMFAVVEIMEGKRAKKTVERLDFQAPKQKEKLKIGDGEGDKLGDIPRTNYQITRMKPEDLKPLHSILFDRPGKMVSIKKNLRLFNGFPFDSNSQEFSKKRDKLLKNSNFTNSKLKDVCRVLDLEKKGTHSDLVDRILTFLLAPKNSGKRVPVKKKKKSKKKLSSHDLKPKTKKSKPTARSSASRSGSKSKAIVMDSSSDEDEDEEEEKAGASAEPEVSDGEKTPSLKEEEQSEEEEESAEEEEEESSKPKSSRGKRKSSPVKRHRTPTKKTGPLKKKSRRETSGESDPSSDADEKPKKKKPAAKTKKADSSSNSKNTKTVEDSSDEDEPLIRMIKKAPSDDQLKETVQSLLKEANLEEMTMKQICQKVFDTFPQHDLSSRKDFIKQTVKSLIT